jgi:hypothetical protein
VNGFPFLEFFDFPDDSLNLKYVGIPVKKPDDGTLCVEVHDQIIVQKIKDVIDFGTSFFSIINPCKMRVFDFPLIVVCKPDIRLPAIYFNLIDKIWDPVEFGDKQVFFIEIRSCSVDKYIPQTAIL